MNQRFKYPFKDRYASIDGVRLHYLDEGQGPPIWLMHGNTTWSYLYRKIIPPLVNAGYRCFVPDLMGFGLSDKPQDENVYSLSRHVLQMTTLIEHLGLQGLTVVGQDWGGPITLRYAIAHKNNVRALVLLNTFVERFPANQRERRERDIITGPLPPGFTFLFKGGAYSSFLVKRLDFFRQFVWMKWRRGNPSKLLGAGFRRPVDPRAMENYWMPQDTPAKRAGLAAFPKMIPNCAQHPNAKAIDEIRRELETWDIPVSVIWPDGDMAWKPDEGARIAQMVPDGEFYLVRNAGHFLQEDAGAEVAARIVRFLNKRIKPSQKQIVALS
ncbi:MAG: alpha/beta fold hydrolase [Gammaproteobacteria bacterium]|nr:alpha/beta fold hydrolase [Gammaproteobacteria bacterium]